MYYLKCRWDVSWFTKIDTLKRQIKSDNEDYDLIQRRSDMMLNNWREETAKDEKRLDVLERFGAIL